MRVNIQIVQLCVNNLDRTVGAKPKFARRLMLLKDLYLPGEKCQTKDVHSAGVRPRKILAVSRWFFRSQQEDGASAAGPIGSGIPAQVSGHV